MTPAPAVFDAVQAGKATYGLVPFENSAHGVVTFTLDCLGDRRDEYADVRVCAEVYLDVHHFLLGRFPPATAAARAAEADPVANASPAAPGTDTEEVKEPEGSGAKGRPLTNLSHIRHVYSHPQAHGQTSLFAASHLAHAELVDVSSTSRAAELAAADPDGRSAAVASEMAASTTGLDVLARCIEDREDNTTRFFVIRKGGAGGGCGDGDDEVTSPPPRPPLGYGGNGAHHHPTWDEEGKGPAAAATTAAVSATKSLVSFTVPHKSPGALADVLQCFSRGGLNLTSINSLPSLLRPFQYLFFVEFEEEEGSRVEGAQPGGGGRVKTVLQDVQKAAQSSRWLGSWDSRR